MKNLNKGVTKVAIILAMCVISTFSVAGKLSINGQECGQYTTVVVGSDGNIGASVTGNKCTGGGITFPTVPTVDPIKTVETVVPTTPVDSGAGSSYPITFNQKWGSLGNTFTRLTPNTNWVWRAPTDSFSGSTGSLTASSTATASAHRTMAISEEPNNFDVPANCKSSASDTAIISWVFDRTRWGACQLTRGKVYYINIAHKIGDVQTCKIASGCTFYLNQKAF